MLNQAPAFIDSVWRTYDRHRMQRRILLLALTFGIAAGTLIFTGCATTEARISQHPEIYHRLSSRDQSLVSQGQIRLGMITDAVWLAWGTPDQRFLPTWAIVMTRRGSICVTKHRPATADRTTMGHSTGPISRQSSCIHPEESLSQTAELYSTATCHRHRRFNAAFGLPSWCEV